MNQNNTQQSSSILEWVFTLGAVGLFAMGAIASFSEAAGPAGIFAAIAVLNLLAAAQLRDKRAHADLEAKIAGLAEKLREPSGRE